MSDEPKASVSRRRYERALTSRAEAERLLEEKSRELYLANTKLSQYSAELEDRILERTVELRRALEKAQMEAAMRSRFIATMSHEIRTPLGGLLGLIELLSFEENDPEKQDLLKNAMASGKSLKRVVNDVLDFSKMEAGVMLFEREAVDIRALIESVAVLARTTLADNERVIEPMFDPGLPALFWGDATRIRQVVANFVSNATRYSQSGPIYIRAFLVGEGATKDRVRVEVEDFGVGIAPEKIGDLFKDFSQVANSLTAAAQGTGLGLAISKRIVEGLGGTVGVESELGRGSTFWFELPAEAVPETVQAARKSAPIAEISAVDLRGVRVLLAEDNVVNQTLLSKSLEKMGVEVTLAKNGLEAVECFAPDKFDIILMDVAMPKVDGIEATRRIRANYSPKETPPILALTAHVMDAIKDEAAQVGIDVVLNKPIPHYDLKSAIADALPEISAKGGEAIAPTAQAPDAKTPAYIAHMDAKKLDGLLEIFSADELANVIESYSEDCQSRLVDMAAQLEAGDMRAAASQVHSIKGASSQLGFANIAYLADQIEVTLRRGSFEQVAPLIAQIDAVLKALDAG